MSNELLHHYCVQGRDYLEDELYHHGIKGMKWGVRRFQNKDGSYTNAGKKRRSKDSFNTNYKQTALDTSGRLLMVDGKAVENYGVTKRQNNKAQRAARREANEYRKAFGSRARSKDELSVMGNKYSEEIEKYKAAGKPGKKRREKLQRDASNILRGRSARANQRVDMARETLNSNDPNRIKNSVHPKDSKNISSAKKALLSEIDYWSEVGERAMTANKRLMSMSIDELPTREYKKRVKEILG